MVPFVTNTRFLVRADWRWVSKNVLDGPTAGTSSPPPTLADLQDPSTAAGSVLYTLLQDASEELMSAACVAARYTEQEIHTYGGNLVESIVCGLAIGPILERRDRSTEDYAALSASYQRASERVEQLRRGERIFWAVPDVPEAGLPESAPQNRFPFGRPGTVPPVSSQAVRYFGFPAAYPGWYYGQPAPGTFPPGNC